MQTTVVPWCWARMSQIWFRYPSPLQSMTQLMLVDCSVMLTVQIPVKVFVKIPVQFPFHKCWSIVQIRVNALGRVFNLAVSSGLSTLRHLNPITTDMNHVLRTRWTFTLSKCWILQLKRRDLKKKHCIAMAQRSQDIGSVMGLSFMTPPALITNWAPGGAACIGYKFGHQVALLALTHCLFGFFTWYWVGIFKTRVTSIKSTEHHLSHIRTHRSNPRYTLVWEIG